MTKDIVVGDELPDWVGAKEFYQKYDPKEVIGRWVHQHSWHNPLCPNKCDEVMLYYVSLVFQGCEQRGTQVCAQTHGPGAGSEDYWDHSGEDDSPAAGGGENLHTKGDPSSQHGEGTLLNQYVSFLLFWITDTLYLSAAEDSKWGNHFMSFIPF